MRILHLLDHSLPQHSGYTFRTASILREQRRLGLRTAHVTSAKQPGASYDGPPHETVDGLRFYRSQKPIPSPWRPGPLAQLSIVDSLAARVREVVAVEKPDILHAHSPALNGLAALRVGRELGLPVVYEIRAFWEDAAVDHGTAVEGGLRYRLTRRMESKVIAGANHVTTICEGLRQDIVARGKPEDRVTVIPNAVDLQQFEPITERDDALAAALGLSDAEVIGYIGSFYGYEGIPLLVQAAARLMQERPRLRLLLVGGGPEAERVQASVKELGISDRTLLPGRVPHGDVNRYYSLLDVLAYPRLGKRITELVTPLKPLESMALGNMVLASDVGGHRELIRDGENGVLFPAGSVDGLVDTLRRTLDDAELRQRCRAGGRAYVESERNWPNSVARYLPIYERLAGASKG